MQIFVDADACPVIGIDESHTHFFLMPLQPHRSPVIQQYRPYGKY